MIKYIRLKMFDKVPYEQEAGCPDISTICEDFENEITYKNSSYICDIISELSDNNVDIYTSDLIDTCSKIEFQNFINRAVNEFGFPEKPDDYIESLYKQAEYFYYSDYLYRNLNNIAVNGILGYLDRQSLQVETEDEAIVSDVTQSVQSFLKDYLESVDINDNHSVSSVIDNFEDELTDFINNLVEEYNIDISINSDSDSNLIRALYVPADNKPSVIYINKKHELEEFYKQIGCQRIKKISVVVPTNDIDIVIDEEETNKHNFFLKEYMFSCNPNDKNIVGDIKGNAIIVKADETGEYISLPDEAIEYWARELSLPSYDYVGSFVIDDENTDVLVYDGNISNETKNKNQNSYEDFEL